MTRTVGGPKPHPSFAFPATPPHRAHVATAAPSGWAAVFDTKNQAFYYHNLATDETTWVLPVDPTARVPDVDETVPEPSPKSSPQLDNPS
ncbi:unnamed protein product, partial [Scytosiphon promiscuus]